MVPEPASESPERAVVILRATQQVLRHLPKHDEPDRPSDTALGDWYVRRIVVDRRPILLLASSQSLISVVIRGREVRSLPKRLPELVAARLRRMGMPGRLVDAEAAAMAPVVVAKTADRSVVGILVDFGKMVPHILDPDGWSDTDLEVVESQLAQNPCYAGRPFDQVVFPEKKTPELLSAKWGAA